MKRLKLLSVLLAVLLILPLLPAGLLTAWATNIDVTSSTTSMTDGNTYYVRSDVVNENRINVTGEVVLVLEAGATLTVPNGIQVYADTRDENNNLIHHKLTIRGSGTLIANAGTGKAAIGSDYSYGEIVIEGGTITATGGQYGAGIGGGKSSGGGGEIRITGGSVTANGGQGAAGIGGGGNYNWAGNYGNSGNITITGGTVAATGNGGGAGIGGGGTTMSAAGAGETGLITISGGSVTATGGANGHGIGPGVNSSRASNSGSICSVVLGAVESLTASSIKGSVSTAAGTVISDGTIGYTGALTSEQVSSFSNKTLSARDTASAMNNVIIGGTSYPVFSGFTAVAGASGVRTNQDYDKLVDGSLNSKYCRGGEVAYVEFYSEEARFIPYGYIFTTGEDTKVYPGRNPTSWTLYGKAAANDEWTMLAEVNGDTVLQGVNLTNYCFPIDYSGANAPAEKVYKFFRINFNSYVSGTTFQLIEMRFYGETAPDADFIAAHDATCTESGIAQDCYLRAYDGAYFADAACTQPLEASAVVLPPLGHALQHYDAVPAGEFMSGTIEYYQCTRCEKYFSDAGGLNELTAAQLTIAPTGHDPVYHEATAATLGHPGNEAYYECSICHKYFADAGCTTELQEIPLIVVPSVTVGGVEYYLYAGFTATSGNEGNSGAGYANLVDNDLASKYSRTGSPARVVFYREAGGFVPYGYIFTTASDAASDPGKNPTDWALYGKVGENDEWTLLAAESGSAVLQDVNSTDYCFPIDYTSENAVPIAYYKYFLLEFCANESGATAQLAELRFYGMDSGVQPIYAHPATCTHTGIAQNCWKNADGDFFADEGCTQPLDASQVILPLAAHTLVFHEAVASTETQNGSIAYYECSVCNKLFADQTCTTELTEDQLIVRPRLTYLNENGETVTATGYSLITSSNDNITLNGGVYTITENVTVNGRISVTADTILVLHNNTTLTVTNCILINSGIRLTICAQELGPHDTLGALVAGSGENGYPAIGYRKEATNTSVITINGGNITANGGNGAAGIGVGSSNAVMYTYAKVIINGGEIHAFSGDYGAAIGTGEGIGGGTITINGGVIDARGNKYGRGTGIGGGRCTTGCRVIINGGVINAVGERNFAAIGMGPCGSNYFNNYNCNVTINGGIITAEAGTETSATAAIGCGGSDFSSIVNDGGTVTITGGQITVRSNDGNLGIGGMTPGGSTQITLGTSCDTDFILSPGYNGTITFANELKLKSVEPETIATVDNIAGKTLIGADVYNKTVTFVDADGTTVLNTQSVFPGTTLTAFIVPDKSSEGKCFSGWLRDGAVFDLDTPILESFTLRANYVDAFYLTEQGVVTALTEDFTVLTADTSTLSSGWYIVQDDLTIGQRLTVNGTVNLILCDKAVLTASSGVSVLSGNALNIYAQSKGPNMGVLTATATSPYYAGIGGDPTNSTAGSISIYGGRITATGNDYCAGIGGGYSCDCTSILIAGGCITATGGFGAAGIGSGCGGREGEVTISGGQVTILTVYKSCGIGRGLDSSSSMIIKLGYTDPDYDFICSPEYRGTIVYLNSMKIDGSDPIEFAGNDNIAGQKLVASGIPNPTATFVDEDGTTVLFTETIIPNGTVSDHTAPVKYFKTFDGWYYNGSLFDFGTTVVENITLTARYTPCPTPLGAGTEDDPFLIASTDDWNKLAALVNAYGFTLAGVYSKLTSDITVSTMIGTSGTHYAGIFDGDGCTLTLDITSIGKYTAPFSFVEGATIKHLITQGTVHSSYIYASGLVGSSYGVTILDCVVKASILFSNEMVNVNSGGFIGHANSSTFTIEGCVFEGRIDYDGSAYNTMKNAAGFVGFDNSSVPTIINCFNNGTFANSYDISPIARVGGRGTITNCFTTVSCDSVGTNSDKRGAFAYSVGCSDYVSMSIDPTAEYTVSGIKAIDGGLYYDNALRAAGGTIVEIGLTYECEVPVNAHPFFYTNAGTLTQVLGSEYTLTMPSEDVLISFNKGISFSVTISDYDTTLGTVTASSETAVNGDTVTVTVIPIIGIVNSVYVQSDEDVDLTRTSETTWTFTMPENDVIIVADFTEYALAGNGTPENPYLIGSVDDWTVFAQIVNSGQSNVCSKLTANVGTVSKMVGSEENPYGGVFDGNGYTLTFVITTDDAVAAPFRYTNAATIKFLTVAGSITTNTQYAAGIIGVAQASTLLNCRSSIEIHTSFSIGNHGGLIGKTDGSGETTVKNCLFDGKMLGSNTEYCAGLIGWAMSDVNLYNNYFAPTEITVSASNSYTLVHYNSTHFKVNSNNWCTDTLGAQQNAKLRESDDDEDVVVELGNGWMLSEGKAIPATDVFDLAFASLNIEQPRKRYTGSAISFDFTVTLLDGTTVSEGFTASFSPSPAIGVGDYTMTVTGPAGYKGSISATVMITEHDTHLDSDNGVWYMLMPTAGTTHVYLDDTSDGFSLILYDDGGPDDSYSNSCDAYVVFHAAEGLRIAVDGSGYVEGGNYDYMYLYDSDAQTELCEKIVKQFNLNMLLTSDNTLTVYFKSDTSVVKDGFALNVTVIGENHEYALTYAETEYGSVTGPASSREGELVTVTLTPDADCILNDLEIYSGNNAVSFTLSGGTATFTMPQSDVTVDASFVEIAFVRDLENAGVDFVDVIEYTGNELPMPQITVRDYTGNLLTQNVDYTVSIYPEVLLEAGAYTVTVTGAGIYSGSQDCSLFVIRHDDDMLYNNDNDYYYVNMSTTEEIVVDLTYESNGFLFYIMDDGGYSGNYSVDYTGKVTVIVPDGYYLNLWSEGYISNDALYVYEDDGKTSLCNDDFYYGTFSFNGINTENGAVIVFISGPTKVSSGFWIGVQLLADNRLFNIEINNRYDQSGTVTCEQTKAYKNDTVILTATPDSEEYVLASLNIVDARGRVVPYTVSGNTAAFVMPAFNVTITPEFATVEYVLDLAHAIVEYDVTPRWTGDVLEPVIIVKNYAGNLLTEGVDYILSFNPAVIIDVGDYTFTLEGVGDYAGSTYEAAFFVTTIDDDLTYDARLDKWYVDMVNGEEIEITLTEADLGVPFFIYDDGGYTGKYSNRFDGTVKVTVPDGYYLFLMLYLNDIEANYDFLYIFHDDGVSPIGENAYTDTSSSLIYLDSAYGTVVRFVSDLYANGTGFGLKVTLMEEDRVFDVVVDDESTGEVIPSSETAGKGDVITLTVVPDPGEMLAKFSIVDGNDRPVPYEIDGNSVVFTMPASSVYILAECQAITFVYSIEQATVKFNTNMIYTGSDLTPTVKVTDYTGKLLTEGVDYTLEFTPEPVIEPGTYSLKVKGAGSYTGYSVHTFTILLHDMHLEGDDDEGWYFDMPVTGITELDLSHEQNGFTITVYDDGGADYDYSENSNSTVKIIAPEGFVLVFYTETNGKVESGYDHFSILDSNGETALYSDNGSISVSCVLTSGNVGYIHYDSDYMLNESGFAVKVMLYKPVVYGDVNGDGDVDVTDVTKLLDVIAGKADANDACDLDNDGEITVTDVTTLLNLIAGVIQPPVMIPIVPGIEIHIITEEIIQP